MRQYSPFFLVFILVLVILYQFYILREGFEEQVTIDPIVSDRGDDDPEIQAEKLQLDTLIKASIADSPETRMAKEKQQKQELLRDIQQIVRNEIAAKKRMTTAAQAFFQQNPDGSSIYSDGSESGKQGCEMYGTRPKWCPKDMNDYIRKDSIPCWGCTLDY